MSEEKRYRVVLTAPRESEAGLLPEGTVVNIILWDGRSPYLPEPDTRLEAEE